MTFDPRSLERLQALGRQLPQELPSPSVSRQKQQLKNSKRHPVETEKNPESLFQELIKASPDGTVPSHLLDKLKKIEAQQLNQSNYHTSNKPSESRNNRNKLPSGSKKGKDPKEEILYASFDRFLLEDED